MNEIKDRVAALVERYRNDVAPIVVLGDPVLRRGAEPYDGQLDDALLGDFIKLMRRTVEKAPGVGLAAPQVGVPLQIAVLEDTAKVPEDVAAARQRSPLEFFTIINPEYAPDGAEVRGFYEGCLSMPGYTAVVNRPLAVEAKYSDPTGSRQNVALVGWPARIFQHEADHLKGTVYVDKMEARSLSTQQTYLNRWAAPVPTNAASSLGFDLDR
ncbi:MAG: peptide deformylase [Terriglobales bacterium]